MLRFLIDTQLPPKLRFIFEGFGGDAIHTTHFPEGHLLDDSTIIELAIQENRIIVTKDSDFQDNFLLKGSPPKVLLIKLGNISNKNLFIVIETHYSSIERLFEEGNGMVVLNPNSIIVYK